MKQKCGKWLADWRDSSGVRRRKASTSRAVLLLICKRADRLYATDLAHNLPRVPRGQARTLTSTEAEFNAMFRAAKPWMRAFLLLTRSLGLRRNEALRICPANIET